MTPGETPYHYAPILMELTLALQHVLNANDWKEGAVPEVGAVDRLLQERGNCSVALSRVRGVFAALTARHTELNTTLALEHEHPTLRALAQPIAGAIIESDHSALPSELRAAPPQTEG